MPVFSIHHITRYEYSRPVKESLNQIKIHPQSSDVQQVLKHELLISMNPELHLFEDYWGNRTGIFTIVPPHQSLVINSRLLVQTQAISRSFLDTCSGKEARPYTNNIQLTELLQPERINSQKVIKQIADAVYDDSKNLPHIVQHCSEYIFHHFRYIKGITDFETTVDEILQHKSGVCQDFAHILLQLLRTLGIPCRYVSGYICPNKNGMRGEGATHAWVEAWIPGAGWVGIDPTNNVWVTENHIKLAVGRNFKDCSPVKGTFKGAARQHLSVFVSVGYEDGQVFEEQTEVTMEAELHAAETAETAWTQNADQQQQ